MKNSSQFQNLKTKEPVEVPVGHGLPIEATAHVVDLEQPHEPPKKEITKRFWLVKKQLVGWQLRIMIIFVALALSKHNMLKTWYILTLTP